MKKPSIVVEVKNGSVSGIYSDSDVHVVLVDYDVDDDDGIVASTQIIPDIFDEMSAETRKWANDAVERGR